MNRFPWLAESRRDIGALQSYFDRRRFRRKRADYYEYLSVLMDGMLGRRTLKDIFARDGGRYGNDTVRGRLSSQWARDYPRAGGDLYATWLGCFPLAELGLIRAAQLFGNTPLIHTLRDLADALRVEQRARSILAAALWSAGLGAVLLCAMFLAVPLLTVPRLRHTFSALPPEYHGDLTRALFDFSALVQAHWMIALALAAGGAALLTWSLPNLTGRARRQLEKFALWRIYRYVNSIRFLALLGIILERQGAGSTQLRTALSMQRSGASKWQDWHIEAMLKRVDSGLTGADTFDTGLLDRDLFWFLTDVVLARGLVAGLALTRERLKKRVLETVAARALAWRWCLLLSCVAGMLGLGLWHYAVVDELRRALMLFYASQ